MIRWHLGQCFSFRPCKAMWIIFVALLSILCCLCPKYTGIFLCLVIVCVYVCYNGCCFRRFFVTNRFSKLDCHCRNKSSGLIKPHLHLRLHSMFKVLDGSKPCDDTPCDDFLVAKALWMISLTTNTFGLFKAETGSLLSHDIDAAPIYSQHMCQKNTGWHGDRNPNRGFDLHHVFPPMRCNYHCR